MWLLASGCNRRAARKAEDPGMSSVLARRDVGSATRPCHWMGQRGAIERSGSPAPRERGERARARARRREALERQPLEVRLGDGHAAQDQQLPLWLVVQSLKLAIFAPAASFGAVDALVNYPWTASTSRAARRSPSPCTPRRPARRARGPP